MTLIRQNESTNTLKKRSRWILGLGVRLSNDSSRRIEYFCSWSKQRLLRTHTTLTKGKIDKLDLYKIKKFSRPNDTITRVEVARVERTNTIATDTVCWASSRISESSRWHVCGVPAFLTGS